MLGATELARFRNIGLTVLGIALALFEAGAVIVLRAHYTKDVFAGAVTALWVASFAEQLAGPVDRMFGRLGRNRSAE